MITNTLRKTIAEALTTCIEKESWRVDSIPEIVIERPKNDEVNGDFSTPVAMTLASKVRMSPRKISESIISNLNKDASIIEKVETAGPGFINFFVTPATWRNEIKEIYSKNSQYGNSDYGKGKNVQVEFVSANPTGPLHVGHGRGAAIGDTIARTLKAVGFNIQKEYYINDVGNQMQILGKSTYLRYLQLMGKKVEFPEDSYQGDYIKKIATEILKEKGDTFAEKGEEEALSFFTDHSANRILNGIKSDLLDFKVEFDCWFSEKSLFEEKKVEETLELLNKKKIVYEKDGATWLKSSLFGDEKDRVLIKENGAHTYFASDIAYHRDKFSRNFNLVIDIWGADHHGYVPRMEAMIEALGYSKYFFKVILVQLVSLRRGNEKLSMSTRRGQFVALRDVLNEVGRDAARYFFLMRSSNSHLDFDLELAKKQSPENPVYYVQYAHARICSVLREAKEAGVDAFVIENVDLNLLDLPEELTIIKSLSQFPEVVLKSANSLETHLIPFYLQELAYLFHSYYNKYRIISNDIKLTHARLAMTTGVKIVLKNALELLAINAPESM
ncbi:MAG: arginine--tRNA ligase [Nitrospinota bacterium]